MRLHSGGNGEKSSLTTPSVRKTCRSLISLLTAGSLQTAHQPPLQRPDLSGVKFCSHRWEKKRKAKKKIIEETRGEDLIFLTPKILKPSDCFLKGSSGSIPHLPNLPISETASSSPEHTLKGARPHSSFILCCIPRLCICTHPPCLLPRAFGNFMLPRPKHHKETHY